MGATFAIVKREYLKFLRHRGRMLNSIIQPIFMIFIFSFVTRNIVVGEVNSLQFLVFGIIGITAFNASMNEAASFIHDKKSGFVKEYLISPISRTQLVIGRIIGDSIKGIFDALVLIVISFLAGCPYTLASLPMILISIVIVCFGGASFGLYVAFNLKSEKEYSARIGLSMLVAMFLSGAYIPISILPKFAQYIVSVNPLTYLTNFFRFIALKPLGVSDQVLIEQGIITEVFGKQIIPVYPFMVFILLTALLITVDVSKFKNINK